MRRALQYIHAVGDNVVSYVDTNLIKSTPTEMKAAVC